jgi:putative FmdB family regulatory protein
MPLYEYQCDACEHRFELIQKFSDPPVEKCPVCGGSVRKLLSSPAIQFKGSGWYITDYARKGGTEATKAEKKTEGDKKDGEKKDAGKTDPKPASETKSTDSNVGSSTSTTSSKD